MRLHLLEIDQAKWEHLAKSSSAGTRRSSALVWGEPRGGKGSYPACCRTQREERMLLFAPLTSRGQKTLLAPGPAWQNAGSASGTLTCTQDAPARHFWLGAPEVTSRPRLPRAEQAGRDAQRRAGGCSSGFVPSPSWALLRRRSLEVANPTKAQLSKALLQLRRCQCRCTQNCGWGHEGVSKGSQQSPQQT